MGHKQDGAGKFIPYAKHIRANRNTKNAATTWNRALRRRIREAIKKSPEEPIFGLRHF